VTVTGKIKATYPLTYLATGQIKIYYILHYDYIYSHSKLETYSLSVSDLVGTMQYWKMNSDKIYVQLCAELLLIYRNLYSTNQLL